MNTEKTFEDIQKIANKLKGNYQFKSPYHKNKKMLPFNILGTISFDKNHPIKVYTIEYNGRKKNELYTSYKTEDIQKLINSGFLIKI